MDVITDPFEDWSWYMLWKKAKVINKECFTILINPMPSVQQSLRNLMHLPNCNYLVWFCKSLQMLKSAYFAETPVTMTQNIVWSRRSLTESKLESILVDDIIFYHNNGWMDGI